jgi:hypothetical protein
MNERSSTILELIEKGIKFENEEKAKQFDEEITRTCILEPTCGRTLLLVGDLEVKKTLGKGNMPVEGWEGISLIKRIFDITNTSKQCNTSYSIEEIRKVEKMGYPLRGAVLVHSHPKSMNPTASLQDIATFITTDLALTPIRLTYAIVAVSKGKLLVTVYNFSKCLEALNLDLRNAPMFDVKFDGERDYE